MSILSNKQLKLQYMGFNQNATCFFCVVSNFFIIYDCETDIVKKISRQIDIDNLYMIDILYKSNIIAIVKKVSQNKLLFWDDFIRNFIFEVEFDDNIISIKLRKTTFCVITKSKLYLYKFNDVSLIDELNIYHNNPKIYDINYHKNNIIIAIPDSKNGTILIKKYELYSGKRNPGILINAHESSLSYLCLNKDGTLLASSSEKGTIIRLFDTKSGKLLKQLRRGASIANIYTISFKNNYLLVSSDTMTVHIYYFSHMNKTELSIKNRIFNYGDCERDISKISIPGKCYFKCILKKNGKSLLVLSLDGRFYEYSFEHNQTQKLIHSLYL